MSNRIDVFLKLMNDRGASDLHLSVGRSPIFRLNGRIELVRYRVLDEQDFHALVRPIASQQVWEAFLRDGDVDFAYEAHGLARFRVNLFRQHRGLGAVFRIIPTRIMSIDQLGLPSSLHKLTNLKGGLVLVTGPTGSGKSTSLSAVIHELNEKRAVHFVTIEDPIEFVHTNRKALISQREIGTHSQNFSDALRAAVREDPDAILVGEMRDLETIEIALRAAEAGFLVFGTLHTNSASKTIDRIINVFPNEQQDGVRGVLAGVLKAVVSQQLIARKNGGLTAVLEILFATSAMASLIREGKTHQLPGLIAQGKAIGMVSMDESLKKLVETDLVSGRAALEKANDKDDMRRWLLARGEAVPDDVAS